MLTGPTTLSIYLLSDHEFGARQKLLRNCPSFSLMHFRFTLLVCTVLIRLILINYFFFFIFLIINKPLGHWTLALSFIITMLRIIVFLPISIVILFRFRLNNLFSIVSRCNSIETFICCVFFSQFINTSWISVPLNIWCYISTILSIGPCSTNG